MKNETNPEPITWRAVQFNVTRLSGGTSMRQWLKLAWGWDIWFNDIPFLKSLLLANVIVWLFMWRRK